MEKKEIIAYIKPLITQGEMKEALDAISTYVAGNDRYLENDILMHQASFNRNSNDFRIGLISSENYNIARARLDNAMNYMIEKLPEKGNSLKFNLQSPIQKILFLSADPNHNTPLKVGRELKFVKEQLRAAALRDKFILVSEEAVEVSGITRAMMSQKPAIVHFSGHGTGARGIVVENDAGNPVEFPTEGLNRLFKLFKDGVRCVVLNACYSAVQAKEISKHGIYVVGMNTAIHNKAAIDFAAGFYQSIGEGNTYEFSFDIAMVNIAPNLKDANTPELWYNGELITENPIH